MESADVLDVWWIKGQTLSLPMLNLSFNLIIANLSFTYYLYHCEVVYIYHCKLTIIYYRIYHGDDKE